MKLSKIAFRYSSLFFKQLPKYQTSRLNKFTISTAGLGFGYAFWYGQSKIFTEQLTTVETDDNMKEGEVRQIQVGPKVEDTILVVKYEGKVYSLQSKCAHFGFPLAKGILIGDKILCPLHNAGFSVKTGQAEQGPIFGGLKTFPVQIKNGKIVVTIPKIGWQSSPTRKQLGMENVDTKKRFVIVGGGPTAMSAINTLRDTGYNGQIVMLSKQEELPYDRTMLSKMMDGSKKPGPIRSSQSLHKDGVTFKGNSTVVKIDYDNKKVVLQNKQQIPYDKLLLATGCANRVPPIPGLKQVQYQGLRNIQDYQKINTALRKDGVKNVTIIGAGFIGMQVASAVKAQFKQNVNVSVIQKQDTPLKAIVGSPIGNVLKNLATSNGINMLTGVDIKQIKSKNGIPESVVLNNQQVKTDVLIVATGVQPVVDYAQQLVDSSNHGIKTNAYLQTDKNQVYAAGDIASFPDWYTGRRNRIEHYVEAIYQGSVAALNMAGKKFPIDNIPFFWTRQFNNSLCVTGAIQGWDDIHITGSLEEMKFTAYYIDSRSDLVLGAAVMNMPNQIQIINEAMKYGVMPRAAQIKSGQVNLENVLKDIKTKDPKCAKCQRCSKA